MSYTLTCLSCVAAFCKIYKYLLLGKGYKSALYLWRKNQSGYKTLFENIALQLFSLPLNCIFLFVQLEVVILDLGPENSFVKKRKDKSFFNRNTCVQQEQIPMVGVALGAVFIKKTRSNYPISLFGRMGILSRNSKIALIITPKLLTCCKKAFLLASSRVQRKSFLQLAIRAS